MRDPSAVTIVKGANARAPFAVTVRRIARGEWDVRVAARWLRRTLGGPVLRQLSSARADATALMYRFENLGCDCEFGFVQRHLGAEPLSLLRFAASTPEGLIAAIDSRFSCLTQPDELMLELDPRKGPGEYLAHHKRYGMKFHTHVFEDEVNADKALALVGRKLLFLARKLAEDLEEARKIYVFKSPQAHADTSIERLHRCLRRGRAGLLYVTPAMDGHRAGSVERMGDGLFRGYLDKVAVGGMSKRRISLRMWLAICRETDALWAPEANPQDVGTTAAFGVHPVQRVGIRP